MLASLIHKIRLLANRGKEPYLRFYRLLGYYPNDLSVYEQALLHKSSSRVNKEGRWENNERLEFLGDAVLGAIIADVLFRRFPTKKEGFLTNTRSKIVQRESLNRIAMELGLDKHIVYSSISRVNMQNSCIYGNALEALIGAIYLDQGYDRCKEFIEKRVITPHLNLVSIAKKEVNFKSALIEWSQKHKIDITFDLIEEFCNAEGNQVFQTRILVAGSPIGVGVGHSKKESQQKAAEMTMKRLRTEKSLADSIFTSKNKNEEAQALSDLDLHIEEAGAGTENGTTAS